MTISGNDGKIYASDDEAGFVGGLEAVGWFEEAIVGTIWRMAPAHVRNPGRSDRQQCLRIAGLRYDAELRRDPTVPDRRPRRGLEQASQRDRRG